MYSYFHLYKPEGINSGEKCRCGHCTAYPELYHASRYTIEPYKRITTLSQAQAQLKKFPKAVIIEFFTPEYEGVKSHMYKNHKTGQTWEYNGHKWTVNP
jgi:hypothetical protein